MLVSPGFGAGWSSWNGSHAKQLAMDKRIVEYVLSDEKGNEKKASLSDLDDIRDQNRIPASCTGSRQ